MKTTLAIDPGLGGGIACKCGDQPPEAHRMPETEGDLVILLRQLAPDPTTTTAVVEQVGGFVGVDQPASRAFTFGRGFGFLLGCLQTMGIRIELVRPQKWQRFFSLGTATSCASKTAWKNKLKSLAQRLFPHLKPTLATTDALLILEYGLRSGAGEMHWEQNKPAPPTGGVSAVGSRPSISAGVTTCPTPKSGASTSGLMPGSSPAKVAHYLSEIITPGDEDFVHTNCR
jgi:hypothetical protein